MNSLKSSEMSRNEIDSKVQEAKRLLRLEVHQDGVEKAISVE